MLRKYLVLLILLAASPYPAFSAEAVKSNQAAVYFQSDSIQAKDISLTTINRKVLKDLFQELSATVYEVKATLPYQILLEVKQYPKDDQAVITIKLPQDFQSRKHADEGFELFALNYFENELEIHDDFILVPARYNPETKSLEAHLQRYFFTDRRRKDGVYEAIFMIGITPGVNPPFSEDKTY